ncbi:hypothetical protein M0812_18162 [Anaeramoeba flamelloides]|uniref:Uncharacterized protein n=1 Tax=Anaeramoeba flamelloides TaxID=1746091 RepID=A0AAV7Z4M5_9EUKA|nr:hypothetical protein M0812_18162 [Anaeramoeba flamelloides]
MNSVIHVVSGFKKSPIICNLKSLVTPNSEFESKTKIHAELFGSRYAHQFSADRWTFVLQINSCNNIDNDNDDDDDENENENDKDKDKNKDINNDNKNNSKNKINPDDLTEFFQCPLVFKQIHNSDKQSCKKVFQIPIDFIGKWKRKPIMVHGYVVYTHPSSKISFLFECTKERFDIIDFSILDKEPIFSQTVSLQNQNSKEKKSKKDPLFAINKKFSLSMTPSTVKILLTGKKKQIKMITKQYNFKDYLDPHGERFSISSSNRDDNEFIKIHSSSKELSPLIRESIIYRINKIISENENQLFPLSSSSSSSSSSSNIINSNNMNSITVIKEIKKKVLSLKNDLNQIIEMRSEFDKGKISCSVPKISQKAEFIQDNIIQVYNKLRNLRF